MEVGAPPQSIQLVCASFISRYPWTRLGIEQVFRGFQVDRVCPFSAHEKGALFARVVPGTASKSGPRLGSGGRSQSGCCHYRPDRLCPRANPKIHFVVRDGLRGCESWKGAVYPPPDLSAWSEPVN